jgi:5-methyltetrahydrofolate--homocysteine methyltransferase
MVPAQKILQTAREEKVDIIGLSGLITPSLDEMVHVAAEMEREGFDIPLLIGGATTSRVHTAVKIHPRYNKGPDGLCHRCQPRRRRRLGLLSPETPAMSTVRAEYKKVAARMPARKPKAAPAAGQGAAPMRRRSIGRLHAAQAELPRHQGLRDYDLPSLRSYIDWTPFFQTWELKGAIPRSSRTRSRARRPAQLFGCAGDAEEDHRREMVRARGRHRLLAGQCRRRRHPPVHGREPQQELATFFTLRQQLTKRDGKPECGAVGFRRAGFERQADYVGGFVVTAGIEEVAIAERFERANDDYSSIMVKALADRFAEAFAERMHERVRKEFWGYAQDETLAQEADHRGTLSGIRPAPGYPAQPDHTEKATLFRAARRRRMPPA